MRKIEKIIKNTNENNADNINWTNAWSKKYPILVKYQNEIDINLYKSQIRKMLEDLKNKYNYNELDAMLILKDILYHEWKDKK